MPSPADTLTLDDLACWAEPGTHLAVLGHPIKHSLSPQMHNAALQAMAAAAPKFGDWRYWKFDVPPERLEEALGLLRAKGFRGVNLTVPHKVLALGLVAYVDPAAREIGAVNTLRLTPGGYEGHNTDGYGLATALREDLAADCAGADVVLLGAGGAARGAAVELLQRRCRSLWIGNRSQSSLDELLAQIGPVAGAIPVHAFLFGETLPAIPAGALIVNATSSGLRPDEPAPIDLRGIARPAGVYDMIYNPPQTALLRDAAALGVPHANGLSMLVHQGARALELWSGTTVPAAEMRRAALAALGGHSS